MISLLTKAVVGIAIALLTFRWLRGRWLNRQYNKALRGDYGDVERWRAELYDNEDYEYIFADKVLPDIYVKETKIIADSKAELRQETIQRAIKEIDELTEERLKAMVHRNS